jgi:hypothetical protein
MFLTCLPKYFTVEFVSGWLNLDSLVNLDTSLCCESRYILLGYLKIAKLNFGSDIRSLPSAAFPWLFAKMLRVYYFDAKFVNSVYTISACHNIPSLQFYMNFATTISADHIQSGTVNALVKSLAYGMKIKSLSFTETFKLKSVFCNKLFNALGGLKLSTLVNFDLSGFSSLVDSHILLLCESYPKMEYLNLSGCFNLSDVTVISASKCLYLKHLNLKGLTLTASSLAALHTSYLHLEEISLGICVSGVAESTLCDIFGNQGNYLTSVDISGISSNSVVLSVGTNCQLLKTLNISGCLSNQMDNVLETICKNCSFLSKLNISNCRDLSVDNVKLILSSLVLLEDFQFAECKELTKLACFCLLQQKFESVIYLDFQHCRVIGILFEHETHLNFEIPTMKFLFYDYSAHIMANSCSDLEKLSLTGPLSGSSLLLFNIPNLSTLILCETDNIHDDHIVILCKSLVNLLTFEIHGCKWISSIAIVALCYSCPQLKVCILDGFGVESRVGDSALLNGVSKLRDLRKLSLFNLPYVSTVGFVKVVRRCLKLNDVKVTSCLGLSVEQVGSILSSYNVLNSSLFTC